MKKKFRFRLVFFTAITVSILLFGIFTAYKTANGVAGFGGVIVAVDECSCSGAVLLHVHGPLPGTYMYRPKQSILYSYGQIRPKVSILGTYAPGPQCRTGRFCTPRATTGLILIAGTSK